MKICIIGGGVGGIISLKNLTLHGFECTLFDQRSTIGGVWAPEACYHGQKVQIDKDFWEFADDPLPEDTPDFPPAECVYNNLTHICEKYELQDKIVLNTKVVKLEYTGKSAKHTSFSWTVHLENLASDEKSSELFDFLVPAMGLFSNPNWPKFEDRQKFEGRVIHSTQWHPDVMKSEIERNGGEPINIVVIGHGKSGTDIMTDIGFRMGYKPKRKKYLEDFNKPHWTLPPGGKATWLCRQWHWQFTPPKRKTSSLIPDFTYTGLAGMLVPAYYNLSLFYRIIRFILRPFAWLVWTLYMRRSISIYRLRELNMMPDRTMVIDLFNPDFVTQIVLSRMLLDKSTPITPLRGEISRFTEDGVILKNGDFLKANLVVLCTGFKAPDFLLPDDMHNKVFNEPPFADDGVYLYKHMIHPDVDNAAYIGMASTLINPVIMEIQSKWLCEFLKGNIEPVSRKEMKTHIIMRAQHHRSFMPHSPTRSGQVQMQQFHYIAELLTDLNVSCNRFGWNLFKYAFAKRYAKTYRDILHSKVHQRV